MRAQKRAGGSGTYCAGVRKEDGRVRTDGWMVKEGKMKNTDWLQG